MRIAALVAAVSLTLATIAQAQRPVVLYGRAVKPADVTPGCHVWCNAGQNDPRVIRSWGAHCVYAYVNAGAWEAWYEATPGDRAAKVWAKRHPKCIGDSYPGWPEERWLDIRKPESRSYVLDQVLRAKRFGFDGVDFDNLNLEEQRTGFKRGDDQGIRWADQRDYVSWLVKVTRDFEMRVSLRHVRKPTEFAPDAWLVESAWSDNFWSGYSKGYRVSLEYVDVKRTRPKDPWGWIIRADRNLTRGVAREW
jgi:hypothetical protein